MIARLPSILRLAGAVLTAVALAAPLAAHGGMYRGPGSIPVIPGGPGTPGGGFGPGPTTGAPVPAASPVAWQLWWEYNKDRYLRLREVVLGADVSAPAPGTQAGAQSLRPTPKEVDDTVLPALDRLMRQHDSADVATACMVAMAKIGRTHAEVDVIGQLRGNLTRGNQEVRETAALALGISGLPAVLDDLIALANDEPRGRKLTGRTTVDERTRAFALYGLGLFARRADDAAIKARVLGVASDLLGRTELLDRDVAVAAIHAIGVLRPLWSESTHKRLGWQALQALDAFWDRKLGRGDEIVQAHVPTAVARLIGRGATPDHRRYLEAWIAELDARERADAVHQSIVLALGELAPPPESNEIAAAASEALWRYYQKGKDQQARYFCLVALGRIGGEENREALMKELSRARKGTEKPWAALALGVLARESRDATGVVDVGVGRVLHSAMRSVENDEFRPACAVALGLCGYAEAAEDMRRLLDKYERHDIVAGYLCIGLALIPDPASRGDVSKLLRKAARRPTLVMQGAIAIALLGGGDAGEELMSLWESGESNLARLAGVATAFRFVGDRRAIEPLVKMMFARDTSTMARAFVAAALGGICDKDMLPWNEPYAAGCNYAAVVQTLTNGVTGILDIL